MKNGTKFFCIAQTVQKLLRFYYENRLSGFTFECKTTVNVNVGPIILSLANWEHRNFGWEVYSKFCFRQNFRWIVYHPPPPSPRRCSLTMNYTWCDNDSIHLIWRDTWNDISAFCLRSSLQRLTAARNCLEYCEVNISFLCIFKESSTH